MARSFSSIVEKAVAANATYRRNFGAIRSFATRSALALTFDDGPDPKHTPALLDILDHYEAKATFFVIGARAEAYPYLVTEIRDRGHAVGNHSYSHASFTLSSWRQRVREIKQCEKVIGPVSRKLFRPPYGHLDPLSPLTAALHGYDTVCWSLDARDWETQDVAWMFGHLKHQTTGGSVILLHDRLHTAADAKYFDRQPVLSLVNLYLDHFSRAYRFRTLPDMFKEAKPVRVDWDFAITDADRELRRNQIRELVLNAA